MANAALLGQLHGADQTLLVQYIGPLRQSERLARDMERRQERLMLAPARERLGFATQIVRTDYQAIFRPEGYRARPHVELYTAGALPVLIAREVQISSFGNARTDDQILSTADDGRRYWRRSRPITGGRLASTTR